MTTSYLPPTDVTLDRRLTKVANTCEAAMRRIRQTFDEWLVVGRGFVDVQQAAMTRSNSETPSGRAYSDWHEALYAKFIDKRPHLALVSPAIRSRAVWMVEHEAEVRAWRDNVLDEDQCLSWNNPSTIKRHYEAWARGAPLPDTGPLPEDVGAAALLADHFEHDEIEGGDGAAVAKPKRRREDVDVAAMTATIAQQADEIIHLIEECVRLRKRIAELEQQLAARRAA